MEPSKIMITKVKKYHRNRQNLKSKVIRFIYVYLIQTVRRESQWVRKYLREFKTFLVSKLKLRCPWDTLKISQDKNVLSNPSNTKLLSDHVSSGGGWSSFGSHARNNGNVTLSTFELKPKTVLYVFYPAKAVMKKKNQKNAM